MHWVIRNNTFGRKGLRDEQWTDRAIFLSGQEIFYAGLGMAGLSE